MGEEVAQFTSCDAIAEAGGCVAPEFKVKCCASCASAVAYDADDLQFLVPIFRIIALIMASRKPQIKLESTSLPFQIAQCKMLMSHANGVQQVHAVATNARLGRALAPGGRFAYGVLVWSRDADGCRAWPAARRPRRSRRCRRASRRCARGSPCRSSRRRSGRSWGAAGRRRRSPGSRRGRGRRAASPPSRAAPPGGSDGRAARARRAAAAGASAAARTRSTRWCTTAAPRGRRRRPTSGRAARGTRRGRSSGRRGRRGRYRPTP